jgi:hypothetical protein
MSGSESSVRNGAAPEALSFTVHRMPEPGLRRDRVACGRWRMLLILLACAAPVIASYLTYYVIRPQGRTNYGTLIQPTRTLPADLALLTLDGQPVAPAALRGQWLMVVVGAGTCDAGCEKRLYFQRQLHAMLGRERDRLDRVWLVTGTAAPSPAVLQAAAVGSALTALRADREAVARWLAPEAGHALEDHLYLVDPMGEWMLRVPADPEPARVKRDLDRVLRATASWDRAGR